MAKQTSIYQPKGFNTASLLIENADGTTVQDLIAAGADDSIIKAVCVSSTDTSGRVLDLYLSDGTTDVLIGSFTVPASAGANPAVRPVDLLAAAWLPLIEGKRVLPLKTGWKLRVAVQVAVTTAKVVAVSAHASDY